MSAVFVPQIYEKAQSQYVQSFFSQNGYIGLQKIIITTNFKTNSINILKF